MTERSEQDELQAMLAELDPESRTLFAEATLGRDAKHFLQSTVGQYLIGCAQQEYTLAMTTLKDTAPWRWRRIRDLQNQAWRAESFMVWLRDLLIKGRAAELSLEEKEEV